MWSWRGMQRGPRLAARLHGWPQQCRPCRSAASDAAPHHCISAVHLGMPLASVISVPDWATGERGDCPWPCRARARIDCCGCQHHSSLRAGQVPHCFAINDPPRTRAWNLRLRGPTPYPLGQRTYVLGQARGVCRSASSTDMRWQSNTCKAMAKPWPARLGFEPGPRARGTSTRPLGQPFLKGTGSLYHDSRAYLTKRA